MIEKRTAGKIDAIFSDLRINPVQLAHLTARMMNDKANANLTHWYTWHIDLCYQQHDPSQGMFDIDISR